MYLLSGLGALSVPALITQVSGQYGIPPEIALAVARRESGLDQAARGTKGEVGVFQLMPSTAAGLNVDPYSLDQNVQGGVKLLSDLYGQFGDWRLALEAYNAGPSRVTGGNVPQSSISYADAVLSASGIESNPLNLTDWSLPDVSQGVPTAEPAGLSGTAFLGLGLLAVGLLVAVVLD